MKILGLAILFLAACSFAPNAATKGPRPDGAPDAQDDAQLDAEVDAAPVLPPSCVGLPTTCGPTGTSQCCTSPLIPGGTFYRSYDSAPDGLYSDMSYPATVSSFRLDQYEVTVGRFRAFVAAGAGTQDAPPATGAGARALNGTTDQGGWDPSWNADLPFDTAALKSALKCDATYQTWTDAASANDAMPINCVSWYEAFAFCTWDGGFLPTEAEWNYAASGGSEQRAYPWSSPPGTTQIDCSHANYDPSGTQCSAGGEQAVRVGRESPVGDGRWSQADLGGNVNDWILDTFESPYPSQSCHDCANLADGQERVDRGGSFVDGSAVLRTGIRGHVPPSMRFRNVGLRCARAVAP